MLRANYHTHTYRCKHAEPDERAYIEHAIRAGIKVLGFSEHAPLEFGNGYKSTYRMEVSEIEDYVSTLCTLREEYKKDIEIKIGLEVEYYPEYFESILESIKGYPFEYFILGQHFLDNEYEERIHSASRLESVPLYEKYVNQLCAGMETGKFSYLAHPDLFLLRGNEDMFKWGVQKICDKAIQMDMPLEINFNGAMDDRHYPSDKFFTEVAKTQCKVIMGVDAHKADMLDDEALYEKCVSLAKRCGITNIVDEIEYRL